MPSIFKFHPIYKERPWGGNKIATLASHHQPPQGLPIGESWEISDRPGDESRIANGEFHGKSIRWLLEHHGSSLMGKPWPRNKRFPLLIKILDASERLSLQVHPPAGIAEKLGGEPKTELWYLLEAEAKAALLAGFQKPVIPAEFKQAIAENRLEPLLHRIPVRKGDAMFIPSGRLHAIDAGCLILEIQQNSDTTYRVYDWGRVDANGRPRDLHLDASLQSIQFDDLMPPAIPSEPHPPTRKTLVDSDFFRVDKLELQEEIHLQGEATVLHVLSGECSMTTGQQLTICAQKGETFLLGADAHHLKPEGQTSLILTACK